MKAEQLQELRELAGKATPRPWWLGMHEGNLANIQKFLADCAAYCPDADALYMVGAGAIPECGFLDGSKQTLIPAITGNGEISEGNAEYIIAACNAVPDLLDALEAKDAEIVRLYMTLKFAREDIYQTICDLPVKSDLDDTLSYIDIAMKQAEKERAGR